MSNLMFSEIAEVQKVSARSYKWTTYSKKIEHEIEIHFVNASGDLTVLILQMTDAAALKEASEKLGIKTIERPDADVEKSSA